MDSWNLPLLWILGKQWAPTCTLHFCICKVLLLCDQYPICAPQPNIEMVDVVQIPATLEPGAYVLQWRWDCEVGRSAEWSVSTSTMSHPCSSR